MVDYGSFCRDPAGAFPSQLLPRAAVAQQCASLTHSILLKTKTEKQQGIVYGHRNVVSSGCTFSEH